MGFLPGTEWTQIETVEPVKPISRAKRNSPLEVAKKANDDLKPGYYMLNTETTTVDGVPKYIYIGAAPAAD